MKNALKPCGVQSAALVVQINGELISNQIITACRYKDGIGQSCGLVQPLVFVFE